MKKIFRVLDKHFNLIFPIFFGIFLILLLFNSSSHYLSIADEASYMGSVNDLFAGNVGSNNHPLFAKTVWYAIVSFFYILTGTDHAIYWRIGTMIFSLGTMYFFFKTLRVFFDRTVAFIGTLLLALDPLYFGFSRLLMLDIPALFFFMIFIYYYLNFLKTKNSNHFIYCAMALGLSLSTKLFAAPILILIPIVLFLNWKTYFDKFKIFLLEILKFELIVGISYVAGNFIYFFKRNPGSFFEYTHAQLSTIPMFNDALAKAADSTSPAWSWFAIPQILIIYRVFESGVAVTVGVFQSPILFFTTIIVVLFAIFKLLKKDKKYNILHLNIVLMFLSLYVPWFLPIRPTYYYYVLPLLPLVIILFIQAVSELRSYRSVLLVAAFIQIVMFIVYFPLLTGTKTSNGYEKALMTYSIYKYPIRNSVTCQLCSPLRYAK